jgi:hypothetical protein
LLKTNHEFIQRMHQNASFVRIRVYMRDQRDNQLFEDTASVTPEAIPGWLQSSPGVGDAPLREKHVPKPSLVPRGLFSRIIKRLGLEKELAIIKRHLMIFLAFSGIFLILSIFAFIGIKHVLATSSFGPYLSLVYSDPGIVIKYWHSFLFAAFESMPGIAISGFIFSLAFLALLIRFVVFAIDKTATLIKSINKQKYSDSSASRLR